MRNRVLTLLRLCYYYCMKGARGGYTIIEVIIVLAVSTLIFFAAVTVFSGKQGKTEFAQAMRDVESRVQQAVNDVRVSTYPDISDRTCQLTGSGYPQLVGGSSPTGTNTACIFLGKAVLLENNSGSTPDRIKVYTVLANRALISGVAVTTFDDINAEAIVNGDIGREITEETNMPFGLQIISSRLESGATAYLWGYYNSLHGASGATEGSQSLKTVAYTNMSTFNDGQIKNAIRDDGSGPAIPIEDAKTWTICFNSGTSNETAQLIINSSFSGITTQVKYTSCT